MDVEQDWSQLQRPRTLQMARRQPSEAPTDRRHALVPAVEKHLHETGCWEVVALQQDEPHGAMATKTTALGLGAKKQW